MKDTPTTAIVIDDRYALHLTGAGHPERPERYLDIKESIPSIESTFNTLKPRHAEIEDLLRCHSLEYCQKVKYEVDRLGELGILDGSVCISTGDAPISPVSYEIALLAAGGVLTPVGAANISNSRH